MAIRPDTALPTAPRSRPGPTSGRDVLGATSTGVDAARSWVFDRAPVGLAVIDGEGTLVAVNASLRSLLGGVGADIVGQHVTTLVASSQHDAVADWFRALIDGPDDHPTPRPGSTRSTPSPCGRRCTATASRGVTGRGPTSWWR